jgi:hypothetical protein
MKSLEKLIEARIEKFKKDITPDISETFKHKILECICLTNVCVFTLDKYIEKLPLSMQIIDKQISSYHGLVDRKKKYINQSKSFKDEKSIKDSVEIIQGFEVSIELQKNLVDTLFFIFERNTINTTTNFENILKSKDSNELLEGFLSFTQTLIGGVPGIGFLFSIIMEIKELANARIKKLESINTLLKFLEDYIFICIYWSLIVEVQSLILEYYPNNDFDYYNTANNNIKERIDQCTTANSK